ncbi:MAG: DUF4369 domain-containing protein [Bacteroidales bacterium]|nr:DUF4369 domain-containing protein [Bacteroidales bacterium]
MRKLSKIGFVFLVCLSLFTACRHKNSIIFEGEITAAAGKKIFLAELSPTGVVMLDSVVVSHDRFTLKVDIPKEELSAKGASFYQIMLSPRNAMTLPAQCGEHIYLKADGAHLVKNYSVTGSPEAQNMAVLDRNLTHFADSVDYLMQIYQKQMDDDSARVWVENQYALLVAHHTAFLRQFIAQHPASLTTVMAFYQKYNSKKFFSEIEDIDLLKTIYYDLNSRYPNNKHVIFIKERVDYNDEKIKEANTL